MTVVDHAPETCEDRGYKCCETLAPQDHKARHGYLPAGCTDECTTESHVEG